MKKITIVLLVILLVGCTLPLGQKLSKPNIEITYRLEGGILNEKADRGGSYGYGWSPSLVTEITANNNKVEMISYDQENDYEVKKSYTPGPPEEYLDWLVKESNFFNLQERYVNETAMNYEGAEIDQITVRKGDTEKSVRIEPNLDENLPKELEDIYNYFFQQKSAFLGCGNACMNYQVTFSPLINSTQDPEEIVYTTLRIFGDEARLIKRNRESLILWSNVLPFNDLELIRKILLVYALESEKLENASRYHDPSEYRTDNPSYIGLLGVSSVFKGKSIKISDPRRQEEERYQRLQDLKEQGIFEKDVVITEEQYKSQLPELPDTYKELIEDLLKIKKEIEQNCAENCVVQTSEEAQKEIDDYRKKYDVPSSVPVIMW